VSQFSDVDNSDRPDSLLQYLDDTDTSMAALKAYVAAARAAMCQAASSSTSSACALLACGPSGWIQVPTPCPGLSPSTRP
jgi:hypothetical protein